MKNNMNFYKEIKGYAEEAGLNIKVVSVPEELVPTAQDFDELDNNSERRGKETDEMLANSMIYAADSLPCGINEDILNKEFPPFQVTKATRKDVLENPEKYLNCSPRVRMGLFYLDEEYENYMTESLNKPLPGDDKVKKHSLFNLKKKK